MPSPVAHSFVGVGGLVVLTQGTALKSFSSFLWERRKEILFFIVVANLPDLDLVIGFLFEGNVHTFHGLFSHSLFLAIPMAWAASFLYPVERRWRTFLTFFILIILHDLMDFSASPNLKEPGSGVELFFPFYNERMASSFPLFLGFRHQNLEQIFSSHNVCVMGMEFFVFGWVTWTLYQIKRIFYRRRGRKVDPWIQD
jgi:hypothetical protein